MRKVFLYSLLLIGGLIVSQFLDGAGEQVVKPLTMFALAFLMIHVGYEFEIDKSRPGQYGWDYVVAATAAAFPWVLCALYFVFVMAPAELWSSADMWKEALLQARFAAPTSAGVLFSMLAAAGLAATWVFKKARLLAIFDDLDTILLMIPLKIMMVGFRWQLGFVVLLIAMLLWLGWKYLHVVRLPVSWPFVMVYAALITALCEGLYLGSKIIDDTVPLHMEVLLPAFVLGCMLARPHSQDPHVHDSVEGHVPGPESRQEQRVATLLSAAFMILVGLSMPAIHVASSSQAVAAERAASAQDAAVLSPQDTAEAVVTPVLRYDGVRPDVLAKKDAFPGWGVIAIHVLLVTILSNVGKMFPALCYRQEASLRERLALSVGMFPRGEVGAGVLVVSLSYGLGGPAITVAVLSLALNLLCTGFFIMVVKKLLSAPQSVVAHAPVEAITVRASGEANV